jgi:hypothetical protein
MFVGVFVGTGYALYYLACLAYTKWIAKFYSTIQIKNKDELFDWVEKYILDKEIIKNSQSALKGNVKHREGDWVGGDFGLAKPEMEWRSAAGRDHSFKYKGYTLWLHLSESDPKT